MGQLSNHSGQYGWDSLLHPRNKRSAQSVEDAEIMKAWILIPEEIVNTDKSNATYDLVSAWAYMKNANTL